MFNRRGHLYIMTTGLPFRYGGRTNSLLQRARLLTNNRTSIKRLTLLTCNYNPNYNKIYHHYKKNKAVNKKMKFMNIYDSYKWSNKKGVRNNYLTYLKKEFGDDLYLVKKGKSEHLTYYYKDGLPLYHLSYNLKENRMGHIDVYSNHDNHSAKRLYMNDKGNIHKIRLYKDKPKNNIVRDIFVDQEMNAYLTREYHYNKNTLRLSRTILFERNGSVTVFNTESEWYTYWFESLFNDNDIIVSDARILDRALLQVNKKIRRIFQAHGPHLHDPSESNPVMKKGFKYLFENIEDKDDVIITLTEGQKSDIIKRYPYLDNKINVIPHCVENDKLKVDFNAVIPNKISIVSRLVPIKRVDHILNAFSEFLKDKPNYTLDIYGFGESEEMLKDLSIKLGIDKHVNFKGFTTNPDEVFQSSEFTIMTSKFEGFGLTILESIINGCPVISYDIKWGPNEIIAKHNGILVKDGSIKALNKAMLEIVNNPLKRKKVSNINNNFTKKTFLNEWNKLLK